MLIDMTKQGLRRLAEAVKARRTELGLAQGDLAERGGPSVVVVGQIERMQQANPQPLTLARLDRALGWEAGSALAVLGGKEPRVIQATAPPHLTLSAHGSVQEPGLRLVEDEPNAVLAAIDADPYLLPEAKAHFRNQYQLLLHYQPPAEGALPYAAHGKPTEPVSLEREAELEAIARAAAKKNPHSPARDK